SHIDDEPTIDQAGNISFYGAVNLSPSNGVTDDNDQGIWFGPPSGLSLIAREGWQVPGGIEGETFGAIGGFEFWPRNQEGHGLSYHSLYLAEGGTTSHNGTWILLPSGEHRLVSKYDTVAPGTGGLTFGGGPTSNIDMDRSGRYAFNTSLPIGGNVTEDNR